MNNGSDQEHIRRHERTEKILEAIAVKQEKTEASSALSSNPKS
ncbi:MAG TPA: hypothetical protein VKV15_27985 [Bryobacteraceae bacterium]|nr:hypothetical protein [Bryobacteraceae bacterium]